MTTIKLKQRTYEELQEEITKLITDKIILQTKIDKAIEYIKLAIENIEPDLYDDELDDLYMLLKILQGEDK